MRRIIPENPVETISESDMHKMRKDLCSYCWHVTCTVGYLCIASTSASTLPNSRRGVTMMAPTSGAFGELP